MNKYSFIQFQTVGTYKDIAEGVQTRLGTSKKELDRPLPKVKNKEVVGLLKKKLGGKIIIKFVRLRAKTWRYLIDDSNGGKNLFIQNINN